MKILSCTLLVEVQCGAGCAFVITYERAVVVVAYFMTMRTTSMCSEEIVDASSCTQSLMRVSQMLM
jgi:hypothetical protein